MSEGKSCRGCGAYKPKSEYYKNRKGLHSLCKTCYIKRNSEYQAKYRSNNRFAIRMRSCRARSKEKDLPFNLTTEYLESIWTGTCPAFGTTLNINSKKGSEGHAQLDRIIPNLGYVEGNVVWLSERANRIKDDASLEDLERLIKWLKSL
jgi:hypothetical protein